MYFTNFVDNFLTLFLKTYEGEMLIRNVKLFYIILKGVLGMDVLMAYKTIPPRH